MEYYKRLKKSRVDGSKINKIKTFKKKVQTVKSEISRKKEKKKKRKKMSPEKEGFWGLFFN